MKEKESESWMSMLGMGDHLKETGFGWGGDDKEFYVEDNRLLRTTYYWEHCGGKEEPIWQNIFIIVQK